VAHEKFGAGHRAEVKPNPHDCLLPHPPSLCDHVPVFRFEAFHVDAASSESSTRLGAAEQQDHFADDHTDDAKPSTENLVIPEQQLLAVRKSFFNLPF